MSAAARGSRSPGLVFEMAAGWLPTGQQLADAGLPAEPLAAVTLDLARVSPAGKWRPGQRAGRTVRPDAPR